MVPKTAACDISQRSMQMLSLDHRRVAPNEALSGEREREPLSCLAMHVLNCNQFVNISTRRDRCVICNLGPSITTINSIEIATN